MGSAVAIITMVSWVFVAPSPAQAYGDELGFQSAAVNTWSCNTIWGGFTGYSIYETGGVCYNGDEVDGTWWTPDRGGNGIKIVLRDYRSNNNQMLGKVEWHPHGEHLWLYDTKNDGDTFYVCVSFTNDWAGACLRPPGTSAAIDYRDFNFDRPEGLGVTIKVYDDQNQTDLITATYNSGTT